MPIFEFKAPDGKTYEIEAPEGATEEQAFQVLQGQLGGGAPTPAPAPGAAPGGPATQEVGTPVAGVPGAAPGPAGTPPEADPMYGLTEEEFERQETARLQKEMLAKSGAGEKFLAGVGQSFDSTGRGLRQLWNYATGDDEELAQLQQREREARALDAPLLSTGAGRMGQITGHVAQSIVPVGMGAKAATTAGKVALNAGLGAVQSGIAPTIEGESKLKNAGTGAVIGGAIPAGTRLVSLVSDAKGAALRQLGKALGGGGTADLKAEAVREAARGQIAQITKRVQIPLAPIKSELEAIRKMYGKDIPKTIRRGMDDMIIYAQSGGKLTGQALSEARTAILRETSKAAQSLKKGAGSTQTGLERLRRTLDDATDEALDALPRTIRDRLFGAPAKRLEAARRQYRTGQAPETVAPYGRAAARAAAEALRRPGPREK